jgi:hypothetical protein
VIGKPPSYRYIPDALEREEHKYDRRAAMLVDLSNDTAINQCTDSGWCPLTIAIAHRHLRALKVLLARFPALILFPEQHPPSTVGGAAIPNVAVSLAHALDVCEAEEHGPHPSSSHRVPLIKSLVASACLHKRQVREHTVCDTLLLLSQLPTVLCTLVATLCDTD